MAIRREHGMGGDAPDVHWLVAAGALCMGMVQLGGMLEDGWARRLCHGLLPILDELGIQPEITDLPEQPPHEFASREAAIAGIAPQLYVEPGTEEMQRLEQFLDRSLQQQDGVWRLEGAQPIRSCIVAWSPVGRR